MSETHVAHTKPLSRMQNLSESRGRSKVTKPICPRRVPAQRPEHEEAPQCPPRKVKVSYRHSVSMRNFLDLMNLGAHGGPGLFSACAPVSTR